jgi:hypothetical protein
MIALNLAEPIPSILNLITEVIKTINLNKEKEIQEISINKSRLDDQSKRISIRHKVLARNIFYPLYQKIVWINILKNKLPTITFTASHIYNSLHYEDGLEHLKQSISGFESKLEEIERKINMYNEDRTEFHGSRIRNSVIKYIRENGFRLPEDNNTSIIAIDASILLPELISFWFKDKPDIEFISSKNSVRIAVTMGHADIAITNTEEDKNRIRDLINELKDLDYIKMELNKFYQVIMDIYNESDKLTKDIGKKIIKFIELEEYDNMCKICNT